MPKDYYGDIFVIVNSVDINFVGNALLVRIYLILSIPHPPPHPGPLPEGRGRISAGLLHPMEKGG